MHDSVQYVTGVNLMYWSRRMERLSVVGNIRCGACVGRDGRILFTRSSTQMLLALKFSVMPHRLRVSVRKRLDIRV